MRLRVLGCSGGIFQGVGTTSFLLDDDILIDAGTGVAGLSLAEMRAIRHIFVTHSHLDHVVTIPLLADTVFDSLVADPLIVHARQETLDVLHQHVFNHAVWPDFTAIPDAAGPVVRLLSMQPGSRVETGGRSIEMIAVNHVVPGAGYRIQSGGGSFAFSGDTTSNDSFWAALNRHSGLDLLIIETAFANKDLKLAEAARHYCPSLLASDLARLEHRPRVCISHLRPGEEELIMQECREALPGWELERLKSGDVFEL